MVAKPMHDMILVKVDPVSETYGSSGLVIPDKFREQPIHCTVLAVGPGKKFKSGERREIPLEPGDRILVTKWALRTGYTSQVVDPEDKTVRVVQASEVMAVIGHVDLQA